MVIKFKTRIDRFGRIVIPKRIRDDFGIADNSELEIETTDRNEIIVHPKIATPFITDKGGILVVCSEPTAPFGNFLSKDRSDRIKKISKELEF
ncbi:MAG: AbrB/MazE/SpoVT family DNA-binding domain-containing protein [Actinobacteria bacterium]|nr:AbrB/MazE/SpoVT family DNA-binding domain-containing protein [Actinomycetota bacterium]